MSDVSSVVNYFSTAFEGFVTTLGGSILAGATTVPLTTTSGLTNGAIFVGMIEPGLTKQQVFTGVIDTSGAQVTGVVWTRGTNADHTAGVTIVDYVTGTAHNMTTAGISVGHAQTGAHKADLPLTTPKITTAIKDANGNEVIRTPATASAVNDITVTNAVTGSAPQVSATGDDTNINLKVVPKGSGFLQLGGMEYQNLTTNSVKSNVIVQSGWSFINNDGTEASTKTITFPVAFDTVLGVLVSLNGETGAAADPTVITEGAVVLPTDAIQATIAASQITTTNFVASIKRTAASSGSRDLFSWLALGVKA